MTEAFDQLAALDAEEIEDLRREVADLQNTNTLMLAELKLQAIALRQEVKNTDPRQCMRLTSLQIRLDRLEGVIVMAEGKAP